MPIGIGINENLVIKSASASGEKKTLIIEFAPASAKKISAFERSMTAGIVASDSNFPVRMFGFTVPTKADMTQEQKLNMIGEDIIKRRNQMTHILSQFMLLENIRLEDSQYDGTGITDAASYERLLLDQDKLNRIYDNLVGDFTTKIKPFLDDPQYAVRLKLIRQSKEKNFATFPERFLDEQPFMELMSVPKEQSNVKFSKWEIDNGFDSSAPYSRDNAEAKGPGIASGIATAPTAKNPFAAQQG